MLRVGRHLFFLQAEQHHCSVRRHFRVPALPTGAEAGGGQFVAPRQVEPGQSELERHLTRCPRLPGDARTARQQAVRLLVLTGAETAVVGVVHLSIYQETVLWRRQSPCRPRPPTPGGAPPGPGSPARRPVFSCSDHGVLVRYAAIGQAARPDGRPVLEGLPGTGTIFWGTKSRGISIGDSPTT